MANVKNTLLKGSLKMTLLSLENRRRREFLSKAGENIPTTA